MNDQASVEYLSVSGQLRERLSGNLKAL